MKITALKTYMQRVDKRPRLLVKIETDEGISGGARPGNHASGPSAGARCSEYMFMQFEGEDPRRIEYINRKLNPAVALPAGGAGLCGDRGDRSCGVGHRRQGGQPASLHRCWAAMCATRSACTRRWAASRSRDADEGVDFINKDPRRARLYRVQGSAPIAATCTRRRGGKSARTRATTLASCASARRPTSSTRSMRMRASGSPVPGNPSSAATRSRRTTRCSTRSRSGPSTSRPGPDEIEDAVPLATGGDALFALRSSCRC